MATVGMRDRGDHTRRTLVTGAAGILGAELLRSPLFADATGTMHDTPAPAGGSVEVDLRDRAATRSVLEDVAPGVVVHTVGLTDVDACERHPAEAYATSALTTANIAEWIAERSPATALVYISSDQVYSGAGPHTEAGAAPVNAYGATKHAGELAAALAPRSVVLRTNFYGRSNGSRPSFTDWIADAVRAGRTIELDERALFSPLHLSQLVTLVADAIGHGLKGVYNAGARDSIDKLSFGREVAESVVPGAAALVRPRAADEAGRAPRPLDLRLDVSRLEGALGRRQPTIRDGLVELGREPSTRQERVG
jgi:dTDP-4-dehydrorhamnose reductase